MKKKELKKEKIKKTKTIKKESYLKGVRKEIKMVKWPEFKEVMKYTISTIIFCVFFSGFFLLLNLIMSWIKGMFI